MNSDDHGGGGEDDNHDDVTLYLHIYENVLPCTLIWLIAGRN